MHAHFGYVARRGHDFIILTTFLSYLFNQGDFQGSFIFSEAKNGN